MLALPKMALSIRQPWAWAILYAGKDLENRSWATAYRGPLAIHAGAAMTRAEYDDFRAFYDRVRKALGAEGAGPDVPEYDALPRGAMLGEADVWGCVSGSPSPWFMGEYAMKLRAPRPLADPLPLKGKLGFFDWRERLAVAP